MNLGKRRTVEAELAMRSIVSDLEHDQRYDYGNEVARGGMGAIHLADDRALQRTVAVKLMLKAAGSSVDAARFVSEARITGRLEHPGIVPVYDIGVDALGDPFYSMKYVRGRDLESILKGLKKGDQDLMREYPLHRLLAILSRVCDAIAYAHVHHVLHRDLKPANIRIGEFGEVLVMDWGLAKELQPEKTDQDSDLPNPLPDSVAEEKADDLSLTVYGQVVGSPLYMAPEQATAGEVRVDEGVDIYALGAILYRMLTLRPPIESLAEDDVTTVLERVAAGEVDDPRQIKAKLPHLPGERVPEPLAQVAMKALANDRDNRYPSVLDFQREIDSWQGGYATQVESAGVWRQIQLIVGRNRGVSIAAALIVVLLVVGSIFSLHQRNVAISALESHQTIEKEKNEQARASAPAYLKSALALEQTGDFDNALITVSHTLGLDPTLSEAMRVRSLLHAREGDFDEALADAQKFAALLADSGSNSEADPSIGEAAELVALLTKAASDADENHWSQLAALASRSGMPVAGVDMLHRSRAEFDTIYADGLPIWKARLEQVWPGAGKLLEIDPVWGLSLYLTADFKEVVTDLDPLRGIPLGSLQLRGINIVNVDALQDSPLRQFGAYYSPLKSIAGLERCPLVYVDIRQVGAKFSATFLDPLNGKQLDYLRLDADEVDSSRFDQLQVQRLSLIRPVTSLAFVDSQKNLEVYECFHGPVDNDWAPLLRCRTLKRLGSEETVQNAFTGFWRTLGDKTRDDDSRLEAALDELAQIEEVAVAPAFGKIRATCDLLRAFVERRRNKGGISVSGETAENNLRSLPDRCLARILYRSLATGVDIQPGLAFLDLQLASIHDEQENLAAQDLMSDIDDTFATAQSTGLLLTGGYRNQKSVEWTWKDNTPWDYSRFLRGEEDHAVAWGKVRILSCIIGKNGFWNTEGFDNSSGVLVQFPNEWLTSSSESAPDQSDRSAE